MVPEDVGERGVILGRHDHHRAAVTPFLLEGQDFIGDRQGAVNEDAVGACLVVGLGPFQGFG